MTEFLSDLIFLLERLNWESLLDLLLVTLVFFIILTFIRDTQGMVLLRGVFLIILLLGLLTTLVNLPAFSWLVQTTLPSLIIAIPVIFAPEIRRGLERLGRAGGNTFIFRPKETRLTEIQSSIKAIVNACVQLSTKRHGALIILRRSESLQEYIQTGVQLNATVTPELLLQIFYPNTPLHDGAAIIANNRIIAAACVMPLSASGILNRTPDRQMGLRHRAALGISEASDAVAVVVSEETGSISVAHGGRMIRRLDAERLENILVAFYRPAPMETQNFFTQLFHRKPTRKKPAEEEV
ncbi:MAG TPA: diadenylate cyclase CdaA [Anaerolineaceae bacterium]|nr:diadenylate cyclase CdaA [Anaerolineaceae bacterium]HPN52737.1 diadenylate cyclase CdaA [Anaerolineaceae bacterium]